MKILVVSDIHANIDALTAIHEPCDAVLCLGDIVDYGPEPAACIKHLQKLSLMRVRGNHDNAVAFKIDCGCGQAYRHLSEQTREYMWQVLGRKELAWLGEPPTSMVLNSGDKHVFVTHAAPSNHLFKYLTPETPDEEIAEELSIGGADIVIVGHSHRPFVRRVKGRLLVNVGSVGQPRDGIPKASYAILEDGKVELRRVDYNVEAAVDKLKELPLDSQTIEELAYILRNAGMP